LPPSVRAYASALRRFVANGRRSRQGRLRSRAACDELAEHAGCAEADGNMLLNTRTLLTAAPVRFLAWNMPYHAEHHSFPAVPFYALPRLHQAMKDDIRHLEPGYISFHRRFVRMISRRV
ncbi:MAG: fatty acid desaturase, partial [Pseudomonadota bacterium]|nr:fatty acid desaturase [Pseudomonadota bacterium]